MHVCVAISFDIIYYGRHVSAYSVIWDPINISLHCGRYLNTPSHAESCQ